MKAWSPAARGLVLLTVLAGVLPFVPAIEALDRLALDLGFRVLRAGAPREVPDDVVIVGIDEHTFETFPEPIALWQRHWGRLLVALAAAGPSVIGLDVVLPDRSYEAVVPGFDRALLAGLLAAKRQVPLVIGKTIDAGGELRPISAFILAAARQRDGPVPIGLVITELDPDRVARRYQVAQDTPQGRLPTLAGHLAVHARGGGAGGGAGGARRGLIDYGLGDRFEYVPMADVIARHEAGDGAALKQQFAGRPVLVGLTLPYEDIVEVPVPLAAWQPARRDVPGVLVHAQALRTLMVSGMIESLPKGWVALAAVVLCALWGLGRRPGLALVAGFASIVVIAGVSLYLLANGVFVPVGGLLLVVILAVGGRMALESVLAYRERHRLRASFGGYVSPGVLRAILGGRISPSMEAERAPVCVLFSDVRDFTTLSESRPPEAVVTLLNAYFDQMVDAVHAHHGTVDKFIGDGLMCFFGAPERLDEPCRNALDAARDMLVRLERLNRRLEADGIEPIAIGIGLHFGPVVVGHVGSAARHEYTAIGDTVNVASRLEGLTKSLGYRLVVSGAVAEALGPDVTLEVLGEHPVKGRAPVAIHGWRES